MSRDLVSIIVPVYKAEKFIKQCIENLLIQTYNNIEIITVYDKSPDRSLEVLKSYESDIKLIVQNKKTNPATARNVGLHYANGRYIAFCDADDYFALDKIERQVKILQENPNVGLVYTDIIQVDHEGNEIGRITCPEWDREYWLSNRFIAFSSILIRREILEDLKEKDGYYFDENLPAFDDFDLLIRLSAKTKFKRVPKFLTYLRFHSENLSKDIHKMNIIRAKIQWKHKLLKHWAKSVLYTIPRDYISSFYKSFKKEIKKWK